MKLRYLLLLCLSCILCACSDDEPQRISPGGNRHDTEQGGDEKDDSDSPEVVNIKGSWSGTCLSKGYVDGENEQITLYLGDNNQGSLTLETFSKRQVSKNKTIYIVEYTVENDGYTVVCDCRLVDTKSDPAESFTLTFEYRENCLYPESSEYERFVLGRDIIYTNIRGEVIEGETLRDLLLKVWVHENGLNILDLSSFGDPKVYQLSEPHSNKYNFYTECTVVDYITYFNGFGLTNEWDFHGDWKFHEITKDKMVIEGKNGKVDTYYPGTEKDIPQMEDKGYILTTPKEWISGEGHEEGYATYEFMFTENGSFYFGRKWIYDTSGTYKINGEELELNFTSVSFNHQEHENLPTTIEGFVEGQPRKVVCPLTVHDYEGITVQIPEVMGTYYVAKFNAKWKVGR